MFKKQYIDQITTLTNKTTRARELLLNGDLDSEDYRLVKAESETGVEVLEARISELNGDFLSINDFNDIIDKAIYNLTNIDVIYYKSNNENKRKLISSIYTEKFTLEDLQLQTIEMSE